MAGYDDSTLGMSPEEYGKALDLHRVTVWRRQNEKRKVSPELELIRRALWLSTRGDADRIRRLLARAKRSA